MTTNKTVYAFLCTIVALLAMTAVFLMTQRLAHAEDTLAEQINCEVYAQLVAQGLPIPPEFESICGDGGGSGGENTETPVDPCEIINVNPLVPDCDENGGGEEEPVDVCPDMEGTQTSTSECPPSNGGGNENPGGSTDPSPSSGSGSTGGSGGFSGGTTATTTATSTGEILGSATSTIACDQYLTSFLKFGGAQNDEEQVKRLQHVLKDFEGAAVEVSGVFDESTLTAVHAFQTKYWDTILAPWDIKQSTGYVYLTTRKKVNEVYCNNTIVFPLSEDENQLIEATKKAPVTTKAPAAAATAVTSVVAEPEIVELEEETTAAEPEEEPVVRRSGVGNFFRRLIDWVR